MTLLSNTFKSFLAGLALVVFLGITVTACGTASDKSSDATENAEGEHPEGGEHPTEESDSTEHPDN